MSDYCTLSPDGFLGVEWKMSCMAHDGRYYKGGYFSDKFMADIDLMLDVWETANLAKKKRHQAIIKTYAALMFIGTSTFGFYWWIQAGIKRETYI